MVVSYLFTLNLCMGLYVLFVFGKVCKVCKFFFYLISGSCHIQNGECEDICVPEENGRRCECDIGVQLQPDQSCKSGKH